MDKEQLDEGERLLAAATPGTWEVVECGYNERHENRGNVEIHVDHKARVARQRISEIADLGCPCSRCSHSVAPTDAEAHAIVWLRNNAEALIAAARERDALRAEVERCPHTCQFCQESPAL